MNSWRIMQGDVRDRLADLSAGSVRCCVTSPPYWGLRDYGVSGQLGLERTPEAFVAAMVGVFAEVRRVLADDGTLWLNLGDTFSGGRNGAPGPQSDVKHPDRTRGWVPPQAAGGSGLAQKQLVGIPWRVAFALQADGWWLRSDIVWNKSNPMPESVTDRPTRAHEYIFLLTKSARYFYDGDAIREPLAAKTLTTFGTEHRSKGNDALGGVKADNWAKSVAVRKPRLKDKQRGHGRRHEGFNDRWDAMSKDEQQYAGSNKRSVWTVGTHPYPDAHFATFPEALIEPCILAGSAHGDTILDPFTGSGTTGAVAIRHQRNFVGVELNPAYIELARTRIGSVAPMFAQEVA
jgi:DNA modification methylase